MRRKGFKPGAGRLQKRIKEALRQREGGDILTDKHGMGITLAPGYHDCSLIRRDLAEQENGLEGNRIKVSYSTKLTESLQRLQRIGELDFPDLVPLEYVDPGCRWQANIVQVGSDFFFDQSKCRRRFVALKT